MERVMSLGFEGALCLGIGGARGVLSVFHVDYVIFRVGRGSVIEVVFSVQNMVRVRSEFCISGAIFGIGDSEGGGGSSLEDGVKGR
jgi:hypothetical protein